jgi:hypothetical protein
MALTDEEEAIAAATLLKEHLQSMGTIDTAWRKSDSDVVCATTHDDGPHLMNVHKDYDADVHLICDTEGVRSAGNLPDDIPDEDHGDIFFNIKVAGVADDYNGYALPTHAAGKAEASLRDDLSPRLQNVASAAGVYIGE